MKSHSHPEVELYLGTEDGLTLERVLLEIDRRPDKDCDTAWMWWNSMGPQARDTSKQILKFASLRWSTFQIFKWCDPFFAKLLDPTPKDISMELLMLVCEHAVRQNARISLDRK